MYHQPIKNVAFSSKFLKLSRNNKYSFYASLKSNKNSIKKAIECLFNIKVAKITTSRSPRKKLHKNRKFVWKTKPKKAVITLFKTCSIDFKTYD